MQKIDFGYTMLHELIGSKWVFEILTSIDQGQQRYSEILNNVPYLSATELRRKLKLLQAKSIIKRHETPSAVSYSLSDFGDDVVHILYHIVDLSDRYALITPQKRENEVQ